MLGVITIVFLWFGFTLMLTLEDAIDVATIMHKRGDSIMLAPFLRLWILVGAGWCIGVIALVVMVIW